MKSLIVRSSDNLFFRLPHSWAAVAALGAPRTRPVPRNFRRC